MATNWTFHIASSSRLCRHHCSHHLYDDHEKLKQIATLKLIAAPVGNRVRLFLSAITYFPLPPKGQVDCMPQAYSMPATDFSVVGLQHRNPAFVRTQTKPRVAATIASDCSDFAAVRGLQTAGHARRIAGDDETRRHLTVLEARFPFLKQFVSGAGEAAPTLCPDGCLSS